MTEEEFWGRKPVKNTFKYSLISDLHLDHPQPKTPYSLLEKNVIVAGDTANGLAGMKFLQKLKNKDFDVFAIPGNHENYANDGQGRTIADTEDRFFDLIGHGPSVEVSPGLTILGANGWYFVDDERDWLSYMNDGRYCGNAGEVNFRAQLHANWLDARLKNLEGKAIVVTHTSPCQETLDPRFEGHYSNAWYYNPELGKVMAKHADKILIWNHGHTHTSQDKIVEGVRVVCNPRGYPRENPDWTPKTIEIEY